MSLIKKAMMLALFYSGAAHLYSFISKTANKKKVIIIAYHRITSQKKNSIITNSEISTTAEKFQEQAKYLSENYDVISFRDLQDFTRGIKNPKKDCAIITFDDGYKEHYSNAFPILKKHRLCATIFLATEYMEGKKAFWWERVAYSVAKTKKSHLKIKGLNSIKLSDKKKALKKILEKLKSMQENKKIRLISEIESQLQAKAGSLKSISLTWDQAREMCSSRIEIGSHTATHPILTKISLQEAKSDIIKSIKDIEKKTGTRPIAFAYPNGMQKDMSKELDELLKKLGFAFSISSVYGTEKIRKNMFRLKRIGISSEDDIRTFKVKASGITDFPQKIYSLIKK